MFFRRFYDDGLAQASYLIGCDASGERSSSTRTATSNSTSPRLSEEGFASPTSRRRTSTPISSREAASWPCARERDAIALTEGGRDWQYAFAAGDGARLLHDGDAFRAGRVRFDVLHTPGHTPEHLAFLVTDLATSDRPGRSLVR